MVILFFQYLTIFNDENLPKNHKIFAKVGWKFANDLDNLEEIDKICSKCCQSAEISSNLDTLPGYLSFYYDNNPFLF